MKKKKILINNSFEARVAFKISKADFLKDSLSEKFGLPK